MKLFNWRPKTITLDDQKSVLMGRRDPATGQSVLRTESDAEIHRKFIVEYVAACKPDGMIEIQLAQRLAQDCWRINRIHAVEENIFALGHSEPFANNMKSAHPEIHAAMVQALTFRNDPKLLAYISLYEQRLTKNFQINFNMLTKLQSLRQPVLAKEKVMTAASAA
jgi:hypothetical protein